MRREFQVHKLNKNGLSAAAAIATCFSVCLETVEEIAGADGREMALVRTKMEEACFFAKKTIAQMPQFQE